MSPFATVLPMASGDERPVAPTALSGEGLRIGIIRASWNLTIVDRLVAGVERALSDFDVDIMEPVSVPGCFEIPLACRTLALSGKFDALIATGAVIRGETTHYEIVSNAAANGIQAVQLETGVPIAFGVLSVESQEQALARSQGADGHNVGAEAARVAVEMAQLTANWR